MTSLRAGRSGHALHRLVAEFDHLGLHRTGTDVDEETRAWYRAQLAADVAIEEVPYTFDRFDHDTALTADGHAVEHLALFYESTANVHDVEPAVVETATVANWVAPELATQIEKAEAEGAPALVAATAGADGRLVALNRAPTPGSGLPVVLVPGRAFDTLRTSREVRLDHTASIRTATSANIVGRAGDHGPEIVLTTPLTGWFTCAGERGPGVALSIDLAARLAEHARVTLLATTGHELEHLGARAWLSGPGASSCPDGVVHLGASIATGPAVAPYPGARVMTHLPGTAATLVSACYADGDATFVGEPERWVSEAKEWVERSGRVLSLSGSFPLFHTADDRVDAATSPARLSDASQRLDAAVAVVLDSITQEHQ